MSYLFTSRYLKVAVAVAAIAAMFGAATRFLPALSLSEAGLAAKFGVAIAALVLAAWLPTLLQQRHLQMLATAVGMLVMLVMGALGVLGWLSAGATAGTKSLVVALCWLLLAVLAGVAGAIFVRWLDTSAMKKNQRRQTAAQPVVEPQGEAEVDEDEEEIVVEVEAEESQSEATPLRAT